jgi:ribonuclease HI
MAKPKKVLIYTDGACKGNPGPGGWGALLQYGKHEKEIYGANPDTTNNQMELMAVIESLKLLKQPCHITIYTDSIYVKKGITEWIHSWKKNNWRTSQKKPVKNADLWQTLEPLLGGHTISWKWVKGHAGNAGNERADTLACKGAEEAIFSLKKK